MSSPHANIAPSTRARMTSASRPLRPRGLDGKHGDTVVLEDLPDVGLVSVYGALELRLQRLVALLHAHRDVEAHGKAGLVVKRRHLERNVQLLGVVADERAPGDGYVDGALHEIRYPLA